MEKSPVKTKQTELTRRKGASNGSNGLKTTIGFAKKQPDTEGKVSSQSPPQTPGFDGRPKISPAMTFLQVNLLVLYFLILMLLALWFFFDVWSKNLRFMQWIGIQSPSLDDPILRTIGFTMVGGFLGSVLYQIRLLFQFYVKTDVYDYRWMGKYVSAPWESAVMAMIVLALIRGGVALFGGSQGTEVNDTNNFAAFGVGALVGFGMRDVVGWIGGLVRTMFKTSDGSDARSVDKAS